MSKISTPDEQPKKDVAKQVISAKQKYFLPEHRTVVDAENSVEAERELKKLKKDKKVGDGE